MTDPLLAVGSLRRVSAMPPRDLIGETPGVFNDPPATGTAPRSHLSPTPSPRSVPLGMDHAEIQKLIRAGEDLYVNSPSFRDSDANQPRDRSLFTKVWITIHA